jgi:hypothetical protein
MKAAIVAQRLLTALKACRIKVTQDVGSLTSLAEPSMEIG